MRKYNTNKKGSAFGPITVQKIWDKGNIIPGYAPSEWRCDTCGNYMFRGDYGDTNSRYGWEVDHIKPIAEGGGDDLGNLQPLQWENNRAKSDNYPHWQGASNKEAGIGSA